MNEIIPAGPRASNVVSASLWMVGITLVLFFLPLFNGLIGGFVGGYKVGTPGRAIGAAVLPAAVASAGLWLLLMSFHLPVIGFVAGLAVGILILLSDLGIFVGALIGGAVSNRRLG
ncbi:MAG: hypothetical protein H7249_05770 [Chitinophagaceae bacterium]|nr:hypothetical protein [Oligoflexus sp.]